MRDKELHTLSDILLQDEMDVWNAMFIIHLFQELRDGQLFFVIFLSR
jgi:hypothetical protein